MNDTHIVRMFEQEMVELKQKVLAMGKGAEAQLARSVEALLKRDNLQGQQVIKDDDRIDSLQQEVDDMTVRMLAKRQPVADDLRKVVAGLKIAGELERIADYSANIAKSIPDLNSLPLDEALNRISRMAAIALEMLQDIIDAFDRYDLDKAAAVWSRDDEIDAQYSELLGHLRNYMSEAPDNIRGGTALLFVSRCCERIGDHITNIAENVHYIVTGESFRISQILE